MHELERDAATLPSFQSLFRVPYLFSLVLFVIIIVSNVDENRFFAVFPLARNLVSFVDVLVFCCFTVIKTNENSIFSPLKSYT